MTPIVLEYNKDPFTDKWHEVMPLCLPDINQRMDCRPNMFHYASQFTPDTYPGWTRVTISLPEKTFSRSVSSLKLRKESGGDGGGGRAGVVQSFKILFFEINNY